MRPVFPFWHVLFILLCFCTATSLLKQGVQCSYFILFRGGFFWLFFYLSVLPRWFHCWCQLVCLNFSFSCIQPQIITNKGPAFWRVIPPCLVNYQLTINKSRSCKNTMIVLNCFINRKNASRPYLENMPLNELSVSLWCHSDAVSRLAVVVLRINSTGVF